MKNKKTEEIKEKTNEELFEENIGEVVFEGVPSVGAEAEETPEGALGRFAEKLRGFLSSGEKRGALLNEGFRGLVFALLAFVFGRTPLLLDTYPLAIALLSSAGKRVPYIFIGAILSTVSAAKNAVEGVIFSPYIYVWAYLMIVFIRALSGIFFSPSARASSEDEEDRPRTFKAFFSSLWRENTYLRMATATIGAFLVSLYAMRAGEYRLYDLFSAMFAIVSAPALTYIFAGLFPESETRFSHMIREISFIAIGTAAVFCLKNIQFFGVNLGATFAFSSVCYFARKRGILYSSVLGTCLGMAYSPLYVPSFLLAAIASGLVTSSSFASLTLSVSVALLWGLYIDGFSALIVFFPALVCSAVIAVPISKLTRSETKAQYNFSSREIYPKDSSEERMLALSSAFSELSGALYDISERAKRPSAERIRDICTGAFEQYCSSCSEFAACRGSFGGDYYDMRGELEKTLIRDGRIRKENLPDYMMKICPSISKITESANTEYSVLLREKLTGEKTELFALDYEAVSRIIEEAIEASRRDSKIDRILCERVSSSEKVRELEMGPTYIYGDRKKKLFCPDIGKKAERCGADDLRRVLESACGFPLTNPIFELKGDKLSLSAEADIRFTAERESFCIAGAGETVCGDTLESFNSGERFYLLISDGMGSGEGAARTSEISTLFLRKMLTAGNRKETALKMLNNLLTSGGEESSASIDLLEVDLISGEVSFIKSGAAPSFVRRGDKLYKLRSGTAPIGIMNVIDSEATHFKAEAGDVIIMLSDGVSQSPEDCFWLMQMLASADYDEFSSLPEKIAERAREEGGRDDISVALVKIGAAR